MSAETFTIPVANITELLQRIDKLNKRADKIGCDRITVSYQPKDVRVEQTPQGDREVYDVTIYGQAPKLNGWQFIATLEHDDDGTIIRRIPTFEADVDLSQYRDATPENCDHCGYKRKRNDTYIVAFVGDDKMKPVLNLDGSFQTKQVGSNCLKDFTGHESPQAIARFLEQVRDLLEDMRGGSYSEGGFVPRYSTREYLARVIMVASGHRFISKKQAWETGETATAEIAASLMRQPIEVDAAEYAWADKIIAWAEALDVPEDDDYLWNVHTVLKNGSLTDRQFGIAASATQAYKRAQQATRVSEFVGEVGERTEPITFTVEHKFENQDYTTYVLRDSKGRSLKWSTGIELSGDPYTATFNVKAHDESRYGKQTIVNYPKNLEQIS